ncbi:WcaI family glycosyltransferase [Hymenobacter nivis]|uniref:Colanic acid biosynthesis glycosyltransferase WcaI n=1 Tax=Hymenobacter nivis TaxID=1850093 RepID=A0A2Z3GZK6_9BACT|nr:WcaI family glycosyltransferase [Hymenobacter nivis]AWM34210.1 colanic acid biosynthesis glycosyltransferase WcaI [Hymenobacter nivis]
MTRKRVLLIGYNYAPEPTGIGKYSGEMMAWLAKNGYDCTVVTTYPYYPHWAVQAPYRKRRFWYQKETEQLGPGAAVTVYRCPMYVPAKPTGLKRMLLDFSFSLSAFFQVLRLLVGPRFDYVVAVAPSFQFGLLGVLYKKIRGGRLAYHIQDLQIEAARDLGMIKSKKAIGLLFGLERFIFNRSDLVTSVGEGMVAKIQEKTTRPVAMFPNWTDVAKFYPVADRGRLKTEFGFQPTDRIALYSGAIGEKQGLEAILHAAVAFRAQPRVKFVICGSGPYKEKLMALARELDVPNVVFLPLQPFEKFNDFLNIADVHLVIQKANAGDLVMPSKLTTVLAVGGVALITSNPGSGMHALVQQHAMGILVEAENQAALNAGLANAFAHDHTATARNARRYAEAHLSIDGVMANFAGQLRAS